MDLAEVKIILELGHNLFYAYQKVYRLEAISLGGRRKRVLLLIDPESGSQRWCRPEVISAVASGLEAPGGFRVEAFPVPSLSRVKPLPYYDLNGKPVLPGTSILLQNGERGTYLGLSRKDINNPIIFRRSSGEKVKCSFDWVSDPACG